MSPFTVANGLSSDLVFALGETSDGDLLVGTQDGLNVLHDGKVSLTHYRGRLTRRSGALTLYRSRWRCLGRNPPWIDRLEG